MRTALALLLALGPLLGALALCPPAGAAAATPRPGSVAASLKLRHETDAAWRKLAALGWVTTQEQRVMVALPGGRRGCVVVFEGTIPPGAIAAARRLPEVEALRALAPRP